MTKRTPHPGPDDSDRSAQESDWMAALDARIAAEDAEDRRRERQRIKAGLPEPPRKIKTFDGWASSGVTPREFKD